MFDSFNYYSTISSLFVSSENMTTENSTLGSLQGNKTDPSQVISETLRVAPYIFPLETRQKKKRKRKRIPKKSY